MLWLQTLQDGAGRSGLCGPQPQCPNMGQESQIGPSGEVKNKAAGSIDEAEGHRRQEGEDMRQVKKARGPAEPLNEKWALESSA